MSINQPCIKCELTNNSNGLFTCNGCGQSFCSNHIVDHSNELRTRFEHITNEYNIVSDIFCVDKQNPNGLQWTIIEKEMTEIKSELEESQKLSNYSEQILDEWRKRLEKIKIQLTRYNQPDPSRFKLAQLLKLKRFGRLLVLLIVSLCCVSSIGILNISYKKVRFSDVHGPIQLSEDKLVAEHNGLDHTPASFRVNQHYSNHRHDVRFVLEKFSSSNTFIGIIESKDEQSIAAAYGWYIGNKEIIYHEPGTNVIFRIVKKFWSLFLDNHLKHNDIEQGDTIELTIDCINSSIVLKNKRTDMKYSLDVDRQYFPTPWQVLISLDHHGDRVRLQ